MRESASLLESLAKSDSGSGNACSASALGTEFLSLLPILGLEPPVGDAARDPDLLPILDFPTPVGDAARDPVRAPDLLPILDFPTPVGDAARDPGLLPIL